MIDRLIELIKQKSCCYAPCDGECGECKNSEIFDDSIESIADHLLANGVTVQEDCKACGEATQNCIEKLQEQIAELRSAQEWISVKDRLPSKEDLELSQFHNFLVANEFGEVREAVFTGKYFAKLGSRLGGVTHWMPLPHPPKGE